MSAVRRKFSSQFKAEAVQLVIDSGRPIAQVAKELEINEGTLGNWVAKWRSLNPDPATAGSPVESARIAELEATNRELRFTMRVLKKSRGLLRQDAELIEKFALMDQEKASFPISMMARALQVSRSGFYAWAARKGVTSPRAARRAQVTALVTVKHEASIQRHGYRRLHVDLAEEGVPASHGMIRSSMTEHGLYGIQPRTKKRTTIPADDVEQRPDLINRDFTSDTPGTRLVGDITYLRTGEGWLYLATVIDLATRMVVGWQMANHMRTDLICDALQMAHDHGHLRPDAIFHSDRGSQYTSAQFARCARRLKVHLSVGRTGSCHDNAVAESWFSMLKNEMYYRHTFATRRRARLRVTDYIEIFYNRKRRHSTLGYRTPAQALTDYQAQTAKAA